MRTFIAVALLLFSSILFAQSAAKPCTVSLDFDGVDDYIASENLVAGNVDLTVEAWFLSEDADGGTGCTWNFERILGFGGRRFELGECDGIFTFFSEVSGAIPSSVTTLDGQWHHAAATKKGNDLVIYLDGEPVITHTFTDDVVLNDKFWVGQWNTTQLKETWDGKIDEVRVWNYARSIEEILSTKDGCLMGDETGLVTYYTFNQGVAEADNTSLTTLMDLSSSANHGAFNNFNLLDNNSNFVNDAPFDGSCDPTCTISNCTVSLDFDGVDDYIASENLVAGNVDLTVEAWFLSEDADGGTGCTWNFERILGFGGRRFELGECDGIFTFFSEVSGAIPSSVTTLDGQWHHAAATKKGNDLVIYLDGEPVITHTFTDDVVLNDKFWVGQWNTTQLKETWDGKIDEVRVWNYARSMEEILSTKDGCLMGDETGLVTYYTFNQGGAEADNTGLTTLMDLSSSANHGAFNNFNLLSDNSNFVNDAPFDGSCDPACASSQSLVSLDFDGEDDFITAKNLVPGNTDFTMETWFLSEDNDGGTGCIRNFERILGFGGTRFEIGECNGVFTFFSELSGPLSSTVYTLDGKWHHAAATKQGNDLVVYLDGIAVITHTFATGFELNDRFWVGQWNTTQLEETWDGKMDEVRVWNYARSMEEVLSTKNSCLVGNETGLVTYYNFNQGTAEGNNTNINSIIDLCPSGNHGVLNNFSLTGNNSNFVSSSPLGTNCTRIEESTVNVEEVLKQNTHFKAYPNPFSHQFTIDFELDQRTFSSIKIYDFLGKEVQQIIQPQSLSAGKHQLEVSLDNLPAGLYIINVALGSHQFNKNIIKGN